MRYRLRLNLDDDAKASQYVAWQAEEIKRPHRHRRADLSKYETTLSSALWQVTAPPLLPSWRWCLTHPSIEWHRRRD